ncbi:hypothetical protein [Algibacter sp. 2305UL17-15]|uniref:TolB family protein n=1 Tax=Algibacter sp. 2305UL17-15 TaxID=3231268 RepID=UPI003457498D
MLKSVLCISLLLLGSFGFSQDPKYQVKNVNINNEYPHFGIMHTNGNQIVFTSYLLNRKGKVKVAFSGEGILTVYKGTINEEGDILNVAKIAIDPNAELGSITSATLSPDGNLIYITTAYTSKNRPKGDFNKANFHIEVGEFKTGVGFTNFKVLPFCKPRFSYAHPSLSADGKTLYFTANVKGGRETTKGGSDIFKVEVLENNTFGKIKNLGSRVNSYSREMFPTISADNTLYFSSNNSKGLGGYDIYKSKMKADGTFAKAEKLPKPFNSTKDDFSLIMFPDGTSGYFVSKRPKGQGDDDIYYFIVE